MDTISRRSTLAALGIVMLGGCGGDDSGPSASAPIAPPPPPPPPPLGTLGLTSALTIPALGYTARAAAGGWDYVPDPATYDFTDGKIAMRFAPPDRLFVTAANYPEAALGPPRSPSSSYFQGELVGTYYTVTGGDLFLSRPVVNEKILSYVIRGYLASQIDTSANP